VFGHPRTQVLEADRGNHIRIPSTAQLAHPCPQPALHSRPRQAAQSRVHQLAHVAQFYLSVYFITGGHQCCIRNAEGQTLDTDSAKPPQTTCAPAARYAWR
jgi:hypothetical protein